MHGLDFEKPIIELEAKVNELKNFGTKKNVDLSPEIKKLEDKLKKMKEEIYDHLTDWQRVQIARHPQRPYTLDYIRKISSHFIEFHGDRLFADDFAFVAGLASIQKYRMMIMGHQKGRDIKENVKRNFGCAHPEGYRKAIRLMKLAEKLHLPIVILIDTPGAYPGIGAEERGQSQAIASNLREMITLAIPIISVIIGEGGSGGALGVGITDRTCILQNAYYSVISPEGCASILWKNSVKAPEAAEALKLTAEHLLTFGIVDEIIPEPLGGAHHDHEEIVLNVKNCVMKYIKELSKIPIEELLDQRFRKFRSIGEFKMKE